jgi:glycine dehydrogenase
VTANNWNHAYTREEAAYPVEWVRKNKYWPPIGRLDDTYGDRNFCGFINN